ncbi:hypothetical protein JOF56_008295 [Kibdelosporangium banguiense]|uniref:Lipoprotein n=1 Tax=Kibdelosporangium banguiense TaxID=1365924 RepID=A0ABS4TU55_9PSEU|nr:hypothetical protein [Kibdelosporangium banguiense]MBP2327910.1 hypothetical protein [Kibdelosporangium banguiense]
MRTLVRGLAAALLLSGCASDDAQGSTLRVLVLDGNLRQLGDPCNGAGPFRYAHADTGYVIKDRAGVEVFRGELPNGTAEKMMDVDFREGMRQPTMCAMTLHVNGLTRPEGHELVIDRQAGIPIEPGEQPGVVGEVKVS